MRYKLIGVLVVLSSVFRGSISQEDPIDCSNTDPVTSIVNDPIDLTHNGIIRIYPNVVMGQITATSNNEFDKKYIDASLEDQSSNGTQSLVIQTTDQFALYPIEQSAIRITLRVDYGCDSGRQRTLIFYQPIKEGNYFSPVFSKPVYEFVLPTPLFAGFNLTSFGEISARDDDLTNNEIQFNSSEASTYHIRVGRKDAVSEDKKTYYAELTLEKIYLEMPSEIRFEIVATDNGQPPLSSTAVVVLRADPQNSLPATPRFEQPVYMADLNENLQLASNIEVTLAAETYSTSVSFSMVGDDQRFFRLVQSEYVIRVMLSGILQETDVQGRKNLWFQIQATNDRLVEVGQTSVIVTVPEPKVVQFKSPLYQGQVVARNNSLAIEGSIVYEAKDDEVSTSLRFELDSVGQTYFEVERRENEAVLKIASGLEVGQWAGLDAVEVQLYAVEDETRKANTTILVHVLQRRLSFEAASFAGTLDADKVLSLDTISILSSDNSSDGIRVHLEGTDAGFFRPKPLAANSNALEIELNPEAEPATWEDDRSFLSFVAVASDELTSASCSILVQLAARKQPKFSKALYVGQVTAEALTLESILLEPDTFDPDKTQFQLAGNDLGIFELSLGAGRVDLRLQRPPTEAELASSVAFLLVLTATNGDRLNGSTSIVIETPRREVGVAIPPIFAKGWYSGRIELDADDQQLLSLDGIHLSGEEKVNDFIFLLDGDEGEYFAAIGNAAVNEVQLQLLEPLPELILTAKTQLNLVLNAFKLSDFRVNGSTFVFVELPRRDCPTLPEIPTTLDPGTSDPGTSGTGTSSPITPGTSSTATQNSTNPGPTESPATDPGTTTPPTPIEPTFDNPSYIFSAKPNQLGSIGSVSASMEGSTNGIRYSLIVENDHLAPRLRIDGVSGELQLLSYINAGVYNFQIEATVTATRARTIVGARLDVDSLIQCEDDQTVVANALLVKYIEEEREHTDILNVSLGDCELAVVDMFPNDKVYVSVDPMTKMLTSIAIDREDPVFAEMQTPQIQVKLKLECESSSSSDPGRKRRRAVDSSGNYSSILTEDIPFRRDVTMLNLIIVDVNDHAPEFVFPAPGSTTHLGYPEPNICLELFPEYLAQVQAIDRDAGLNAKIRYSMRDDPHFAIDPESGVVYPKANAFQSPEDDSTSLLIMASDRDGAADGLRTGAVLFVQRLGAEFFTLLTLATTQQQRQDVDEVLQQLRLHTGAQVEAVRTATIPGNLTVDRTLSRSRRRRASEDEAAEETILQKVWVYALDSAATAVRGEDFKRKLDAMEPNGAKLLLSAETYSEVGLTSSSNNQSNSRDPMDYEAVNNGAFIAAVSVLAVLLTAACCFILWHFYLRHRFFERPPGSVRLDEKDSATPPLSSEPDAKEPQSKTMADFMPRYVNHTAEEAPSKRPSLGIAGSTTQESTDEKADVAVDVDTPAERGHVKFNELVERIHIAVDGQESEEHEQEQKRKDGEGEGEDERL